MGFLIFVLLLLVALLLAKWREVAGKLKQLSARLDRLEHSLARLKSGGEAAKSPMVAPPPLPVPEQLLSVRSVSPANLPSAPDRGPEPEAERPAALVPPIPGPGPELRPDVVPREIPLPLEPVVPRRPVVNWENFLGVKLFAWLGGLALFLGVAFFVKYSFERNLISPPVRVAMGYGIGLGLLAGGWFMPRARHVVTVQTLCATGIVVLYAVSFAADVYYHLWGAPLTFALMTLVTAVAFFLAVRLEAQVIAVLGLLGGFLTPPLLSTGVDNPLGLFGYLAVLDLGLIAVALRKRWNYQVLLAGAATVIMQFVWVNKFFVAEKVWIAFAVFLGFAVLFVGGFAVAQRLRRVDPWISAVALVMPSAALLFALFLLWHPYPELAHRPLILFSYVFLADAGLLLTAWLRDELRPASGGGGAAVFLLLTSWTVQFLSAEMLNAALGFYFVFALLHSVFPLVLEKLRPSRLPLGWIHAFPSVALVLILVPLFKIASPSFLLWPVVLMIDLVAIILAILTASLVSILAVFVLTVLATAVWIFQLPAEVPEVPGMLVVIGGFALFFMAAAVFAARKVLGAAIRPREGIETAPAEAGALPGLTAEVFGQIVSLTALLPFSLLTLMLIRLPLANPSPVFGLAALLLIVLLGLVRFYSLDLLAAVGLLAVLMVEYVWHFHHFAPAGFGVALGWHLGFPVLLLLFPFLFQKRFESRLIPWGASALALPLHFTLIYRTIKWTYPAFEYPGIVPALLALPCALGLLRLVKTLPAQEKHRPAVLALFGGSTLFFVTLIFPIQFERQWITVSWALEGVALLWLFHRIPHPGLRTVGLGLLLVSFVRLALNPAVILDYERSGRFLLNWYLYSYGIVTVCLMSGGRLLAPPRDQAFGLKLPPWLYGMGTALAFLLVNIEIADSFSSGPRLSFQFSANFGQDMTYSLAWAGFAFVLLAVGFRLRIAAARYAGMGLLVVTLLKLFLHDLWRLGGLYRIGSLVGLAVVLMVVSFIYQRFLSGQSSGTKEKPAVEA